MPKITYIHLCVCAWIMNACYIQYDIKNIKELQVEFRSYLGIEAKVVRDEWSSATWEQYFPEEKWICTFNSHLLHTWKSA